mgnify:FL=1
MSYFPIKSGAHCIKFDKSKHKLKYLALIKSRRKSFQSQGNANQQKNNLFLDTYKYDE